MTYGDRHLSYHTLDRRSDQLADLLRRQGIVRGQNVGLLLSRSPEMVIALLAILKAGAAYVPLDPIYPIGRLRHILERAGCRAVVSEEALVGMLPRDRTQILRLESLLEQLDVTTPAPGWPPVCPDSPAYIVFTSGSTGAPKGVVAHHRGSLNHLDHVARRYSLSSCHVVLQTASLISDASIEDLFGALLSGCRIVLMPSLDVRDPAVWHRLIEQERVTTILASTPRFLAQLGQAAKRVAGDRGSLRLVFVNGEPLTYEDCAVVREGLGSQVEIINQYGPTEAAITASEFSVDDGSPVRGRAPSGLPLSNVEFHLLDEQMRPVLRGSPGEAYIGGVGLAHGYQAEPALTADRFLPSPFATSPGARLYRTGDNLVFSRSDGFHFVGRLDHQVNIRGYRIEPGEIESAIESYPGVVSSRVVPWTDDSGNELLVAYLATAEEDLPLGELRQSLKSQLPRYMVPAVLVPLAALPLTPNGKVDRSALPSPAELTSTGKRSYVRPVDSEESALCRLFEEVLSRVPVGRHDDFFDLGGHSLAAIHLASLLSERLGFEVPVRDVFLNPTVAELAATLRAGVSHLPRPGSAPEPFSAGEPHRRRHLRIHRDSLREQIRCGELPPVEAVAVSTLPNELRPLLADSPATWKLGREPEIAAITDTTSGRIASIWLPVYTSDVYRDPAELLGHLVEALDMAEEIGASAISLTGLLGSATAQGADVVAGRDASGRRIAVTTGHATTVASILLAINDIVATANRHATEERVAILGIGSIGAAVAESLPASGFEPRELLLCDVYDRRDLLARTVAELETRFEHVAIRFAHALGRNVPDEVYDATLIVGATNAPEVLDVDRLRPGTLIVDDSVPYCFDARRMLERIRQERDLLATTGGLLRSPRPVRRDLYLTEAMEMKAADHSIALPIHRPNVIPACAFSALLTATSTSIEPTVGPCTAGECLRHLTELLAMEMTASPLQLSGALIDCEAVTGFATRRNVDGR